MTQEFHISVTPVGPDEYLVRTEQVAPGVPLAEELVTWPVANWLAQASQLMNDPLLGVLRGGAVPRSPSGSSLNLVNLGQQLYNALFQGSLRDSWVTAQGIAQHTQEVLRLRLGLKELRLSRLPWEVLYAGDRPVATGPYVAFSRYQAGTTPVASRREAMMGAASSGRDVKVLMAIAGPRDQASLALKQEAENLQTELRRLQQSGEASRRAVPELQLTILEQPGREQLTQALEQGEYQVLHYAGHSNLGPSGGELYLVSGKTGLTETLSGDDLAGLLVNNGIQMAVFNSCRGAYNAPAEEPGTKIAPNLTEALVRRGIRSVLAMAERIPDEVALTLTQLFYRNLSQGYPVDLSLSRARQGLISAYGSHNLYWALPILYLQPEADGYLTNSEMPFLQLAGLTNEAVPMGASAYAVESDDWESLAGEEMTERGFPDVDVDLLDDEDWDNIVNEIEYDDPAYEEDSALVSDLFQQLSDRTPTSLAESSVPTHLDESPEEKLYQIKTTRNQSLLADSPNATTGTNPPDKPPADPSLNPAVPPIATATLATPSHFKKNAPRNWLQHWPRSRRVWSILGTMGVAAIAALGVLLFQNRDPQPPNLLPQLESSNSNNPNINLSPASGNLKTSETSVVTAIAIEQFNKGDFSAGQTAVEELLKRNALQNARAALAAVPVRQADGPDISFLRGRLAWQSVQVGDSNFSVDDARRYWAIAVKAKPNSVAYHNALGFAHYAEGNLNLANQTWFQALYLLEEQQAKRTSRSTTPTTPTSTNQDALNAYAGLALVMSKSAQNQSGEEQTRLLSEAIKLRQKVLTDDPVNFQPQNLSKNWLWTEKAIQDWQKLLQLQAK